MDVAPVQDLRRSGIDVIGSVPWGTHFCQFYATGQDLAEILVPYFIAGLASNEYCMWVTSAPLQVAEAEAALRSALPDLDDYIARGQIEILDYGQWYWRDGRFDADEVLQGWADRLEKARERGFEGLRLTGNTFWLEQAIWEDFTRYEEKINQVIGDKRMVALCTYSLERCGIREILDVVMNHQFALIKNGGRWEILESVEHQRMEQALRESEERYRSLFTTISEGFGLHEIICDGQGEPVDYRFLEINPAFEEMTGLKRDQLIGRTVLEVLPGTESYWIDTYGQVALTGQSVHFQNYSSELGKLFQVVAFSPEPGKFATLFIDITERKHLEEEARLKATEVELHHRLLVQREQERMQIARDLHDGPLQELTAATYMLQPLMRDGQDAGHIDDYKALQTSLKNAVSELRNFAQELRPPSLTKFGLEIAIRSHLETFKEKHPGIDIQFEADQKGNILPDAIRVAMYRIYQETLNNIVKHAHATQVRARFNKQHHLALLEIEDNGVGFELPYDWLELARQGHLGLVGIRERAEAVGGTVQVISKPNCGTQVRVLVPLGDEDA